MRENKRFSKKLNNLYYSTFSVKGLNLDYFIEKLKKKGVFIGKTKRVGVKEIKITIKNSDIEKFFAISKELCYTNIVKENSSGAFYFLTKVVQNFGIIVGIIFFVVSTLLVNDYLFEFNYSGDGQVYSQQVTEFLKDVGIKKYSRFSDIKLNQLEDDILAHFKEFSFVSCKKQGNKLNINLVLATDKPNVEKEKTYSLISNYNGVVKAVKVYRGTAMVKVGDTVNVGDILVDGYATIKENVVKVNVIASVTISKSVNYIFISEKDNQEDIAGIFAKEVYGEPNEINVEKQIIENKFHYMVNMSFYKTVSAQ